MFQCWPICNCERTLQPVTTIDITIIILPGIILGTIFGFGIGEMKNLRTADRIVLAIIVSSLFGIILALLFNYALPISYFSVFLGTISFLGGLIFGLAYNWPEASESAQRSHIVYEPDDDEDFEREIEEAFRGKQ